MSSSKSILAAGPLAALVGLGHLSRKKAQEAEAKHPPIGQLITVNGIQVHYTDQGPRSGSAPTLILIHGAGGNLRDFTFQLSEKMAKTNRVIAFDRPGHGYTGVLHHHGESPQEQAELLHDAAIQIGLQNAIICGYSLGGAVALAWALAQPGFCHSLLLISPVSHPWPGGVGLLFSVAAHAITSPFVIPPIAAFAPDTLVQDTLKSVFSPKDPPQGYLEYVGAGLSLRAHTVRANTRQVSRLRKHVRAMVPEYANLHLPVEILHGTKDRTVYPNMHAQKLVRDLPNATYTRLPGVGHAPHHHSHDAILAALARLNQI